MKMSTKEAYFEWLCDKVKTEDSENRIFLLNHLFKKEFYYIIALDQNREKDGKVMRDRFVYRTSDDEKVQEAMHQDLIGPSNILEVMVSLAERMDFELINEDRSREPYSESFWEMVKNADWFDFTDCEFGHGWDYVELDKKIEQLLERKFKKNGEGSWFPISGKCDDQRKTEIWYQMQAYLIEKYPV